MKINQVLYISFILFISAGCSSPAKHNITEEEITLQEPPVSANLFKETALPSGIEIQDLYTDVVSFDKAVGAEVSLNVRIAHDIFTEIEKRGYKAVFINIKALKGDTVLYSALEEEKKNYNTRIHSSAGLFMSGAGEKFIDLNIPYRKLLLKEGSHNLDLKIEFLPARFKTDSTSSFTELLGISGEDIGNATTELTVHAPKLYQVNMTVYPFSIDKKKKDPSTYDFRMSGSGYPDIFWELQAGGETIYRSKPEKNSHRYPYTSTSGKFAISEKDRLQIRIIDEDNGPFNKMDVIDSWEGNLKLLKSGKQKKLDLQIVTDFSVQLSIQ